jgi:hypothetical protein
MALHIHLSSQALELGKLFAKDEEDLLDIECGLHSGFPPCCVIFYITVWARSVGFKKDKSSVDMFHFTQFCENYLTPVTRLTGLAVSGYVPCPACILARHFVTTKKCNCMDIKQQISNSLGAKTRQEQIAILPLVIRSCIGNQLDGWCSELLDSDKGRK